MIHTTSTNCFYFTEEFEQVKEKVLNWIQRFDTFSFLDNHQYQSGHHSVECLAGAGVQRDVKADAGNALSQLQQFIDEKKCWLFGHLGYDLKNEIEELHSKNPRRIHFPDLYFFEPQWVIRLSAGEMWIEGEEAEKVFEEIMSTSFPKSQLQNPGSSHVSEASLEIPSHVSDAPVETLRQTQGKLSDTMVQSRLSSDEYISIIQHLKQHILRGDCYEINFCQEFYAEQVSIDPIGVYKKLGTISPNPFSACYRVKDQWLMCASPERYLRKEGLQVLSQPIKGTSRRMRGDEQLDEESKLELARSAKDRSENVMVVDLVRNDLAKICREGSVKVDELFGIYSFPQVHQMISTISGVLREDVNFEEIISATFPMGSMTGAPKKRVMELIEEYEVNTRGIFSGATGYISPDGDFDLNVVIRSIMYNAATGYLSFQAGSGITFNSDPQNEWEECLMKADAMKKVLGE